MHVNGCLVKFVKTIMWNKLETFNGNAYLKVIGCGRIRLYGYGMHTYVHLTEKMKWLIAKYSF